MQVELYISEIENTTTREICEYLHHLILSAHPQMTSKIRFKIPFYDVYKWICYLNPLRKGGVELVFLAGRDMEDPDGWLDAKGRKMVKGITLQEINQIDEEKILFYLMQAIEIDKSNSKKK